MTAQSPRTKKRPPARTYDLDVVGRLDRVTAPKQARSEASLQRVLAALEELLQTKPFSEVSIPEIAGKAQCSAATIYGRFQDKGSILAALHESLRERMRDDINTTLELQRWCGRPLAELAQTFCRSTARFYDTHRHLLTAALVLGDAEIYERANQLMHYASLQLGKAAAVTRGGRAQDDTQSQLAAHAVFALLQQRLLFGTRSFGWSEGQAEEKFMDALSSLLLELLRPNR